jgi:phosphoribosylpyrophosphate synthetase
MFIFLQVMNLIGDVRGKVAVMMDDMIDTAGKFSSELFSFMIHPRQLRI